MYCWTAVQCIHMTMLQQKVGCSGGICGIGHRLMCSDDLCT